MNKQIYLSTNTFPQRDLGMILEICRKNGFTNLELSACQGYNQKTYHSLLYLHSQHDFSFLLHNYFPSPQEPFVINLASNNSTILKLSREHCVRAIDLASEFNSPLYSVHLGACYHANPEQLGQQMTEFKNFPKEEALSILIESLRLLADHASKRNILLGIENHVLAPYYLIEGENKLLFGVTAEEMLDIILRVKRDNLKVLVDLGHLKVSAQTIAFSPREFIQKLASHIKAFHLSDNNGKEDEHKCIRQDSWFWEVLSESIDQDVLWILEASQLGPSQIIDQVQLVDSHLKKRGIS